jgi:hypothetical protein
MVVKKKVAKEDKTNRKVGPGKPKKRASELKTRKSEAVINNSNNTSQNKKEKEKDEKVVLPPLSNRANNDLVSASSRNDSFIDEKIDDRFSPRSVESNKKPTSYEEALSNARNEEEGTNSPSPSGVLNKVRNCFQHNFPLLYLYSI